MSVVMGELFDKLPLRHVWIFLTEKCNLSCDYCFFGDRGGRRSLSIGCLRALFDALPRGRRHDIVLSGGEPLLDWPLVRKAIAMVRERFGAAGITLQTNGFLLDRKKIDFLKVNGVAVQPGIDGPWLSNVAHRRGTSRKRFHRLACNLENLLAAGVPTATSMTVHPAEVELMRENFLWLVEQGLLRIEVHPAFLAPWDRKSAVVFERAYADITAADLSSGGKLLCRNYSLPISCSLDLVVQPDGRVLPNWTHLIFQRSVREKFYLMDVTERGVRVRRDAFAHYWRSLRRFFDRPRTYRDFSNFNAARILRTVQDRSLRDAFSVYQKICARAQAIDQRCLKRSGLFLS